jgi:hypothetical protein
MLGTQEILHTLRGHDVLETTRQYRQLLVHGALDLTPHLRRGIAGPIALHRSVPEIPRGSQCAWQQRAPFWRSGSEIDPEVRDFSTQLQDVGAI